MTARRARASAGGAGRPAALSHAEVYALVRRIPRGRVASYGQVARLLGHPGAARQVGYALAALRDTRVPWHRVVNARGEVSPRAEPGSEAVQRRLLEREGIGFDAAGRVSLARFGWTPHAAGRAAPRRRATRAPEARA